MLKWTFLMGFKMHYVYCFFQKSADKNSSKAIWIKISSRITLCKFSEKCNILTIYNKVWFFPLHLERRYARHYIFPLLRKKAISSKMPSSLFPTCNFSSNGGTNHKLRRIQWIIHIKSVGFFFLLMHLPQPHQKRRAFFCKRKAVLT